METVTAEFPSSADWTPVRINDVLLRVVAIVSGHAFVGPELCHREEYLTSAIDFTTDIVMAVPVLKRWPRWLRPLANYLEPQVEKVREHRRSMKRFLAPAIEKRRAAKRNGEDMPQDTLQWMIDNAEAKGITSATDLTNMQLLLTMAATHTTTLTVNAM